MLDAFGVFELVGEASTLVEAVRLVTWLKPVPLLKSYCCRYKEMCLITLYHKYSIFHIFKY